MNFIRILIGKSKEIPIFKYEKYCLKWFFKKAFINIPRFDINAFGDWINQGCIEKKIDKKP